MEVKINRFSGPIVTFINGGDQLPWTSPDIVVGCEREVADANKGASDEGKNESIMRLSWALVHSKQPEDVQRGIAMLEGEN
uniref:Protein kinase n=1 Tax=Solanum tuberosum TaxID=4113 RepID=M1AEE7_SOLTU